MNKKFWSIVLLLYLFYGRGIAIPSSPVEAENRYCIKADWHNTTPSGKQSYVWYCIDNDRYENHGIFFHIYTQQPTRITVNGGEATAPAVALIMYEKGMGPIYEEVHTYHHETTYGTLNMIIDDPAVIDSITFENENKVYICEEKRIRLDISKYYDNNKGDAELYMQNRNSDWIKITTIPPTGSTIFINYSDIIEHVGLGKPIKFRTKKTQLDEGISYYTSTKILYYLPQFKFPTDKKIEVDSSLCYDPYITIRVPYQDDTNYTLTIQKEDGSDFSSLETNDADIEGDYYVITRKFMPGKYELYAEHKISECPVCGCKSENYYFTIPEIPKFKIDSISYTDKADGFQVPINGGKGKVSFNISGSKDNNVRVYASGQEHAVISSSLVKGNNEYYSGSVVIELSSGTYSNVYVRNTTGCQTSTQTISLTQPNPISFSASSTSPTCNGNSAGFVSGDTINGTITISNTSGGIGTKNYIIKNNTTNTTIKSDEISGSTASTTGLPAGSYDVEVSDAHGNAKDTTITISPPSVITATTSNPVKPTLSCTSDGAISVFASGDCGNFQYSREQNGTYSSNSTVSGYSKGENVVYIQDDCGCIVEKSFDIPFPDTLAVESLDTIPPTCNGGTDGKCKILLKNRKGTISVLGLPYSSHISLEADGNEINISGLEAGNYTARIIETYQSQQCTLYVPFTIPVKPAISITPTITEVSDKGTPTGKINISVSGGNEEGGYNVYLEDSGSGLLIDSCLSVLQTCVFDSLRGEYAGKKYAIHVFDTKGCTGKTDVFIKEPQEKLRLSAEIINPVLCYGDSTAQIKLTAEKGWGAYQYSCDSINWPLNDSIFSNYPTGTHKLYVKDKWNGTATVEIFVGQPNPLVIVRDSIFPVLCQGEHTGLLRYRISGGTYPYTLISDIGTVTESIINGDTLFTISGLPTGRYNFTVTDSRNCSATALKDTIKEPAKLLLPFYEKINTTCELDNGVVRAKAIGGVSPYTYELIGINISYSQKITLNENDTVRFGDLAPAQYRVLVTDNNACVVQSDILDVLDYINPHIDAAIIKVVDCFGENNGSIQASAVAGTAPVGTFALHDSNDILLESNASGLFENLFAGNYKLYVYDEAGCRSNLPYLVEVKAPNALAIAVDTVIPVAAKGTKEGRIYFRVLEGNVGSKTVRLKDENGIVQDSLSAVNNLQHNFMVFAGNYTLEVGDYKHCTYSTNLLHVEEPEIPLHFTIVEKQDALCKSQTGRIEVEGAGGWGDYRYKRVSDGQFSTLNRFENLYPGEYMIEVSDKMGAVYRESIVVHEPQDSLRAEVTNIQSSSCGNNGRLSIRISGGTAPYIFINNQDTVTYTDAGIVHWNGYENGAQTFCLIDNNGCRFELETLIPQTDLLQIEGFDLLYPATEGASSGAVEVFVSGGIEPYTYEWKRNFTDVLSEQTPLIENLYAAYYQVTVSDAGGCSVQDIVYLANPGDSIFEIIRIEHETAFEAANGSAVLCAGIELTEYMLVSPGKNIYNYTNTDIANNFRVLNDTIYLSNLNGGKWFVSGKSIDGKQVVADFTIHPYPEFTFSRTAVTHVAAKGDATGSIKIEIKGGGGENQFTWTNSQNETLVSLNDEYTSIIDSLETGLYTIVIEDKYGNKINKTIEVQEPAEKLTISLVDKKDQDCKDYEDAWVVVSANGGWGDYQFRHDEERYFNNGSSFVNLPTRDNYFYLVDKMGAIDTLKIEITEPEYLRAAVAVVDSVKCKDNDDGSILFNITGGTPPYRFKELGDAYWIDGNHALNRSEGWYTYVFTDSHDCVGQDTLTVYVPEPDSLLFRDIQVTHTTCELDNGKIIVSLQGGTRPYYYSWLDYNNEEIGTDSIITDLKQNGVYTLNVFDANGCTQQFVQLINPSTLPRVLAVETTEVLCYGDTTGTARITDFVAATPYAPYTFTWSNGDTGDYSARFEKGIHHVTIEDENGCSTTFYFEITEPEPLYLEFSEVVEPQCYGYGNGYIRTETFGGQGEYSYLWSTGATTPHIEHLFKGRYWVELIDENGCYYRKEITLGEPEYKTLDLGEDLSICPGNTVVIDGQDFSAYRWFTSMGDISTQRYLNVTKEDYYFLEATDENGCSVWGDIYVSVGNHALTADMLLASQAAVGDTVVVFELSNMELDSIGWIYDAEVFERVYVDNEYNLPYIAHFRCLQTGMYNIGLYAYAGGCYSPVYKQIEVLSEIERDEDDWGYKEPLIVSLTQYPNPTDGEFTLELELREEAEVNLTLFEVASGICINQRSVQGQKENRIEYNLNGLNTGTYALIVTAGNERRQVKIIIAP